MHHFHHEHHRSDIPLFILGSYVVGYLAGHTVGILWLHGPADAHGVRRLVHVKQPADGASWTAAVTDVGGGDARSRRRAA